MTPDTEWATHLSAEPSVLVRPTVELTGPGTHDLARWVAEMLADSIHDGDTRADAWSDYVIAVGNLKNANDAERPDKEADVADAWWALESELPNAIRLSLPDATVVGLLLDRTTREALHGAGRNGR